MRVAVFVLGPLDAASVLVAYRVRVTQDTIELGGELVPLLRRPWTRASDVPGYRALRGMQPGDRWADLPWNEKMLEHLVLLDGERLPVGVAIARELLAEGADWAYCAEVWGSGRNAVFLDTDGVCVEPAGEVAELLDELRAENGGSLDGLPDAIARVGGTVLMREAKRVGKDQLRPSQHRFACAARILLGRGLDLAVVEWDV